MRERLAFQEKSCHFKARWLGEAFTVKVGVEKHPQSDTKMHSMAMGREFQVEGIANAQAMRHGCARQVE